MLKEFLLNQKSDSICWRDDIQGIKTCRFALDPAGGEALVSVPVCGEPFCFEALFCMNGRLTIRSFQTMPCAVEAPGIFLFSDTSRIRTCLCSRDLGGILLAVDAVAAKESLKMICSALGMELNTKNVRDRMAAANGYIALPDTSWTRAVFETMTYLSGAAGECYCVFKSVELLYLLCSGTFDSDHLKRESEGISPRTLKIKDYMLEHLSEKMTIQLLCRKFLVSPTFLKENFRRAYGVPIHTWLIQQRIKRGRELLCTTQMTIREIAQAVGYESISQFHTAFKGYYGMAPGQYRKMSETISWRPFW